MPQDYLTETCIVTHMRPSHPDPRRWQARQHQDKPLHFIFSDPLPSTTSLLGCSTTPHQGSVLTEFPLHITAIQLH